MAPRFPESITLRGVSRTYGRAFALHRVDLDLKAGSICAVVGDNGAGKSTLLDILATVEQPDSGQVTYGEISATRFCRKARQCIGWVSHKALLYRELTARENLEFFATMYGIDDIESRAQTWLQRVGLSADGDRRVRQFSRGMKQRLTIARALIHNPQLLLFDEPTTGLDRQGTEFAAQLLDGLRQRGRLIVLVTHDFDLVDGLVDHLVILRRGRVVFDEQIDDDDPLAIYRTHA